MFLKIKVQQSRIKIRFIGKSFTENFGKLFLYCDI